MFSSSPVVPRIQEMLFPNEHLEVPNVLLPRYPQPPERIGSKTHTIVSHVYIHIHLQIIVRNVNQ